MTRLTLKRRTGVASSQHVFSFLATPVFYPWWLMRAWWDDGGAMAIAQTPAGYAMAYAIVNYRAAAT